VVEEGELKLLNFRLVLLKKDEDDADGEATSDCSGVSLKLTANTYTHKELVLVLTSIFGF
jgi:hypothetical protein